MRLIDADKVIKILESMSNQYKDYIKTDELILKDKEWYKGKINGIDAIKSILESENIVPTAYNPDKVVEELESDEKHTFDGCINKRYAIEIVKRGGVNV